MAKVAQIGKQFFVHDVKRGWVDGAGNVVTVNAESNVKFHADETEAAKHGYVGKPKAPEPKAPEPKAVSETPTPKASK